MCSPRSPAGAVHAVHRRAQRRPPETRRDLGPLETRHAAPAGSLVAVVPAAAAVAHLALPPRHCCRCTSLAAATPTRWRPAGQGAKRAAPPAPSAQRDSWNQAAGQGVGAQRCRGRGDCVPTASPANHSPRCQLVRVLRPVSPLGSRRGSSKRRRPTSCTAAGAPLWPQAQAPPRRECRRLRLARGTPRSQARRTTPFRRGARPMARCTGSSRACLSTCRPYRRYSAGPLDDLSDRLDDLHVEIWPPCRACPSPTLSEMRPSVRGPASGEPPSPRCCRRLHRRSRRRGGQSPKHTAPDPPLPLPTMRPGADSGESRERPRDPWQGQEARRLLWSGA